jgi:hypothetical protein
VGMITWRQRSLVGNLIPMRTRILLFLFVMTCSAVAFGADINGDGVEVVLFPLAFSPAGDEVPGAHGTVWTGSVWVHNRNNVEVTLHSCPPAACPGVPPDGMGVLNVPIGTHPEVGYLLYPSIAHAPQLTFANRIFERTRLGQPRGVNIPVVREGEFFSSERTFLGVPTASGVRAGIRIYDPWLRSFGPMPTPRLTSVTVEVLNAERVVLGSATLVPEIPFSDGLSRPGYAAIHDLSAVVPQLSTLDWVHIRVRPQPANAQFYAMVAVTDNETQTVSIITAD